MPKAIAGPEIERLIQLLARLPGLGPRSARRAALHLIKKRDLLMAPLAAALQTAIEQDPGVPNLRQHRYADSLHGLHRSAPRQSVIVVVADVADLWALERAEVLNARYHVLGGTLSPLDGIGPQDLTIDALVSARARSGVKEIILALNATVDKAKATAFDDRMFAGPLGQKTYACFVRRYDASHLAQHPSRKSAR